METIATKRSEELERSREKLFRELDKGIRDMEQGDVMPCDEVIRDIRTKYGLV